MILSLNVSICCQKPVYRYTRQLALRDQALEGLLDEFVALLDVVEDVAPKAEVAGVDPELGVADLAHAGDQAVVVGLDEWKLCDVRTATKLADGTASPRTSSMCWSSGRSVSPSA